jgi:hypothetical protein
MSPTPALSTPGGTYVALVALVVPILKVWPSLQSRLVPALANRGNPTLQRLDVELEVSGPGHFGPRRCGLIVAGQPLRTFRHRGIQRLAILLRDIRNSEDLLRLDAGPEPFDDSVEKHLLKSAFPRLSQKTVEVLGLLLVSGLVTLAKELLGGLPLVFQVADLLLNRQSNPGQFLGADACALGKLSDMLIQLLDALLLGESFEQQ